MLDYCDTECPAPNLVLELVQRDSTITGYMMTSERPSAVRWPILRGGVMTGRLSLEVVSPDLRIGILYTAPFDTAELRGTYLAYYLDDLSYTRTSTWNARKEPSGEIHSR